MKYRFLKAGEVRQAGDEVLANVINRWGGTDLYCSVITSSNYTPGFIPQDGKHYWTPIQCPGLVLLPADLMATKFRRPI